MSDWKKLSKNLNKRTEEALDEMGDKIKKDIRRQYRNADEDSLASQFSKAFRDSMGSLKDGIDKRIATLEKEAVERETRQNVKNLADSFADAFRNAFGGSEKKRLSHNGYDSAAEDPNVEFDENGDIHAKGEAANDAAAPVETEDEDDFVTFSYQPGDTFGQKIIDLGLATGNGLWGDNGDVNFYTKQLIDGGYLDANGNVKLGVPIRLKRRK